MKNIEIAKLLYEMKPGDPPSLHIGDKWYTMWNSNTVEEAWQEAESISLSLFPDWEHDWDALKELLIKIMENFAYTLSIDALDEIFVARLESYSHTFIETDSTIEKAIVSVLIKALTFNPK